MKKLNDLEYLKLGKMGAFWYNLKLFILSTFPLWLWNSLCLGTWNFIKKSGRGIKNEFVDIGSTFTKGNWAVKLSFFLFGFGNIFYGQVMRGRPAPPLVMFRVACSGWKCMAISLKFGLQVMTPLRCCCMVC